MENSTLESEKNISTVEASKVGTAAVRSELEGFNFAC